MEYRELKTEIRSDEKQPSLTCALSKSVSGAFRVYQR